MSDNTTLNPGASGDVIGSDDIAGVKYQRIKLIHGADGTNDGDVSNANPLPVIVVDTTRTDIQFYAVGQASGTTGTETMITLSKASGTAAVSTGTSFVITSGKRFRITSITFGSRGHATATIQVSTFTLRINTGGATVVGSLARLSHRTATPATASAWDRFSVSLPDAGYDIAGDGTLTFGVSANAVFTTNAPTWDVLITGYEY
jgi:hypothetical protein